MKYFRIAVATIISLSMLSMATPSLFADQTSDVILKILIKKGILSQTDVDQMRAELQQKTPAPPEGIENRVTKIEDQLQLDKHPSHLNTYWDKGFWLASPDDAFKLKVGARIMADWAWIRDNQAFKKFKDLQVSSTTAEDDQEAGLEDTGAIQEARIYLEGTLYEDYSYRIQVEMSDSVELKDTYGERNNLPVVDNVRVGQFKEPMGLENNTSSRYITFMARSLPQYLMPERDLGVMIYRNFWGERIYAASGVFRDIEDEGNPGDDGTSSGGGEYSSTSRLTVLPWYEEGGLHLLHSGFSFSYRIPNDSFERLRIRPESDLAAELTDTGAVQNNPTFNPVADNIRTYAIEQALVYGPFSLQGEMAYSYWKSRTSRNFKSWYLFGSYFLTGEHRPYDPLSAEFGRVIPNKNFGENGGWGAWEAAARWSYIDASDRFSAFGLGIANGVGFANEIRDITVGVNWYLTPNTRIMFNWINVEHNIYGEMNIIQTRFQVDF